MKNHRVNRVQAAFYAALALLAGATAAVGSHWAIDAAGDVLLLHDSYDGIAHHSRVAFIGIAVAIAALVTLRFLWEALDRRSTSLLALLRRLRVARGASPYRFVALVVTITIAGLAAMESADVLIAGAHASSVADLFGGSIVLGLTAALTIGSATALLTRALFGALVDWEPAIVAFVVRILRRRHTGRPVRRRAHVTFILTLDRACRLAQRDGKRAPPLLTPA